MRKSLLSLSLTLSFSLTYCLSVSNTLLAVCVTPAGEILRIFHFDARDLLASLLSMQLAQKCNTYRTLHVERFVGNLSSGEEITSTGFTSFRRLETTFKIDMWT